MPVTMKVGQKVDITLCPMCTNGSSSVNGTPTWQSSNTGVASVQTTSQGGLAARIIANSTGSATITATAVGQNGNIVNTVDITVTATYATSVNAIVSEPFN